MYKNLNEALGLEQEEEQSEESCEDNMEGDR